MVIKSMELRNRQQNKQKQVTFIKSFLGTLHLVYTHKNDNSTCNALVEC